ncbi:MAG TPA: hypothetical protein VLM79_15515, partial [Kofleriaceae bacterium]|nr:hypothetical protein [Kofleriaceae bacterium]
MPALVGDVPALARLSVVGVRSSVADDASAVRDPSAIGGALVGDAAVEGDRPSAVRDVAIAAALVGVGRRDSVAGGDARSATHATVASTAVTAPPAIKVSLPAVKALAVADAAALAPCAAAFAPCAAALAPCAPPALPAPPPP